MIPQSHGYRCHRNTDFGGSAGDLFRIGDGFTLDFQETFDVGGANPSIQTSLNNQLASWNSAMTRRETGWKRSIQIEVENDSVTVDENGTATTRIRLSGSTTKTIHVARFSGDSSLDVSGGATINFNSGIWNSGAGYTVPIGNLVAVDPLHEEVTVRLAVPLSTAGRQFIRLKVEE